MEPYEATLNLMKAEVSLGYTSIHIYKPSDLEAGQVGYSIGSNGQPLTGKRDGDWRKSWLVIGYDETCGDPIFIDTSEEGYPVYTALVGKGRWDPKPVAISLKAFSHSLSAIADVAKGREYPVALKQNPLTEGEKEAVLSTIRHQNPKLDISFWEILLTNS
jgi:hypothetical protein